MVPPNVLESRGGPGIPPKCHFSYPDSSFRRGLDSPVVPGYSASTLMLPSGTGTRRTWTDGYRVRRFLAPTSVVVESGAYPSTLGANSRRSTR